SGNCFGNGGNQTICTGAHDCSCACLAILSIHTSISVCRSLGSSSFFSSTTTSSFPPARTGASPVPTRSWEVGRGWYLTNLPSEVNVRTLERTESCSCPETYGTEINAVLN